MKISHPTQTHTIKHFAFIMLFMATLAMSCSNQQEFDSLNQEPEIPAEELLTKANFDTDAFVTEWLVPKDSVVILPLDTNQQYNCIIDWGDDSDLTKIFTKADYKRNHHRYSATGVYRIKILGDYPAWNWAQASRCKDYLTKIVQWGNINLQTLGFANCINLVSIPSGIPNLPSYTSTFSGCTGLTSLPDELFAESKDAVSFFSTFSGCKNIKTLPPNLFKNCYKTKQFVNTFLNSGLISLPENLFRDCINAEKFYNTFMNNLNLVSIPADLFSTCTEDCRITGTFRNCLNLAAIPISLFDNCKKTTSFMSVFEGCTSLSGITPETNGIKLWDRSPDDGYPANINGSNCFNGCTNLADYKDIPKEWGGGMQ